MVIKQDIPEYECILGVTIIKPDLNSSAEVVFSDEISDYLKEAEKTKLINKKYGVGTPGIERKLSFEESEFVKSIGWGSETIKSVKSTGRLDDAYISRYSVLINVERKEVAKIILKDSKNRGLAEQLNNEWKINLILGSFVNREPVIIKAKGVSYTVCFPEVLKFITNKMLVFRYIQPDLQVEEEDGIKNIEVYSKLNFSLAGVKGLKVYSYTDWYTEWIGIANKLINYKLVLFDIKQLERILNEYRMVFNNSMGFVHGDAKLGGHILFKNNRLYLLDCERSMNTTKYYDSSGLVIRCLREGKGLLIPFIYDSFCINTEQIYKFHLIMENFLILREYLRVFTMRDFKGKDISIIPYKKYRDFKILIKRVCLNFQFLGLKFESADLNDLFIRNDIPLRDILSNE